jgi:hypothetical protein
MGKKDSRTISSLFMLFSFIVLVPSGIAMHVVAEDGPATASHVAMTLHNVSALVFLISALTHIVLNRASIMSAIRSKTGSCPLITGRSAVVAMVLIVILAAAVLHVFIVG